MEDSGRAGPCELRQPPVLFLREKKSQELLLIMTMSRITVAAGQWLPPLGPSQLGVQHEQFLVDTLEQDYSSWWLT